jgi:hypothetical protein
VDERISGPVELIAKPVFGRVPIQRRASGKTLCTEYTTEIHPLWFRRRNDTLAAHDGCLDLNEHLLAQGRKGAGSRLIPGWNLARCDLSGWQGVFFPGSLYK